VAVVLQRQIAQRLPSVSGVLSSPVSKAGHALSATVTHPLSQAFGASFWVVLAVNAFGLVASLFLPKGRPAPVPVSTDASTTPTSTQPAGSAEDELAYESASAEVPSAVSQR
jgi:hypothetical protein